MSHIFSNDDNLFKIYGILNTTYEKDYQLKDELFGRVFYHVFGMKNHSKKITSCFKSWLSIIFERMSNNQDYNHISYKQIITKSNNSCSLGTCSNMFSMLEHAGLIHKVWKNGGKASVELDIDALVDLFIENQVQAVAELDKITDVKKKAYNRRRRYALAKNVCNSYNDPTEREKNLMELSFNPSEAVIYDLLDTFYVRQSNPDYHITFADVMTVMNGIVSYNKDEMTIEEWDSIIFNKLASRESGTIRRLVEAIKNPKVWNKSFKTPYFCRFIKESFLDNNCSFNTYSKQSIMSKEDTKLFKRTFILN